MSIRTIDAPGVEIKEIDKSGYAPAMTGTKCYVMGFANKGEPYVPMLFTSRASWVNYYGEPDNEAEKYFFNACMEVINQNGVLYSARLPYDNVARDQYVAFSYNVDKYTKNFRENFKEIVEVDPSIDNAYIINSKSAAVLTSNEIIDEYRTDESKVTPGTFMIVDKSCAPYRKIQEDYRKGQERELLGIVPVVTTPEKAMYVQKLIDVGLNRVSTYESIGDIKTQDNLYTISALGPETITGTKENPDLVVQLNTKYKRYSSRCESLTGNINTIENLYSSVNYLLGGIDGDTEDSKFYNLSSDNGIDYETNFTTEDLTDITCYADLTAELDEQLKNIIEETGIIPEESLGDILVSQMSSWEKGSELPDDIIQIESISDIKTVIKILKDFYENNVKFHGIDGDDSVPETISQKCASFFPSIQFDPGLNDGNGGFDRTQLKKIGLVVLRAFIDPQEGNKIAFEPVESFVGTLGKDDKDINTGMSIFMDNIVNTQSNYVYFFSNCFNKLSEKKFYNETLDIIVSEPCDNVASIGYYENQVKEDISLQVSIYDGINKCFDKVSDINERDIDIVCDAGLANIASFTQAIYGTGKGGYNLNEPVSDDNPEATKCSLWKADKLNAAIKTWKTVEQKFDNFCKNVRKDCMFIADGLRPMVIQGEKKIVRESKPKNNIDVNIIPYVKLLSGLNTSYGAGYLDWFQITDEFTGDFFWCPPSIKAMGIYINTDLNFEYWDAPAGLNRGVVSALDCAFSPTPKQAGAIYTKNWNYAINYPDDGIVLEGQKTFQVKPSAFDRVNVRRLFLRLERQTYKIARYFVYEGNTAYTRQRLVDILDPMFYNAKVGGGVYDYKIICDESINTSDVIDRNEMKVKIGIKPVKVSEYILVDFVALSTGGSWSEM